MKNITICSEKEKFNLFVNEAKAMYNLGDFSNIFTRYILYIFFDNLDIEECVRGLGSNDESIDAFFADEENKKIYFIQCKSKNHYDDKSCKDAKKEWFAFLNNVSNLLKDNFSTRNKRVKEIENLWKEEYKTFDVVKQIYHMGDCSEDILKNYPDIEYFNMSCILEKFTNLYEEDLDIAPDKIEIQISIQQDRKINNVNDIVYFTPKARNGKVRSTVVFPLSGDKIIEILKKGTTILERNVRGYLGQENAVNKGIIETALNEPEYFYFFNNGISITCNKIEFSGLNSGKQKKIILKSPQIINGAQTVNSLKTAYDRKCKEFKKNKKINYEQEALEFMKDIYVICKIMESTKGDDTKFATSLTKFNNKQNKIIPTDFYSNLPEQNMIKAGLIKYEIDYLTKRGKFISKQSNGLLKNSIKMDELSEIIYWRDHLFFKTSIIFREEKEEYSNIYKEIFGESSIPDSGKVFKYAESFYLNKRLLENLSYVRNVFNNIEKMKKKSQEDKNSFIQKNSQFKKFMKNGRYLENVLNDNDFENKSNSLEKNIFMMDKNILWYIFWNIYTVSYVKNEDFEQKKTQDFVSDYLKHGHYYKINDIVDNLTPSVFKIYLEILVSYHKKIGTVKKIMYNNDTKELIENLLDEHTAEEKNTEISM